MKKQINLPIYVVKAAELSHFITSKKDQTAGIDRKPNESLRNEEWDRYPQLKVVVEKVEQPPAEDAMPDPQAAVEEAKEEAPEHEDINPMDEPEFTQPTPLKNGSVKVTRHQSVKNANDADTSDEDTVDPEQQKELDKAKEEQKAAEEAYGEL